MSDPNTHAVPRPSNTNRTTTLVQAIALAVLFAVIIGFAVFRPAVPEPAQAHALTSVTNSASVNSSATVVRLGMDAGGQVLLSAQATKWAVTSIIIDPGQCVSINGGAQKCSPGTYLRVYLGVGQYYVRRTR